MKDLTVSKILWTAEPSPEQRLFAGVIETAIRDWRKRKCGNARHFLFHAKGGLVEICELLDLDPDYIRKLIKKRG